ncbi:hypothetical protein Tco_1228183 [Tanacetum coccineum]
MCTKLSKQLLDLEVWRRILKLWRSQLEEKRIESLLHDDLDKEDASKQGRKSDKTKPMFKDSDFDGLDDDMENVEGETVYAATSGVSTARALVSTASPTVSTAGPSTSAVGTSTDAELAQLLHQEELAQAQQEREREQFTIEERAQFLVEMIAAQRKFRATQRAIEIRSKPPTKTQLRNMMITYLKNMESAKSDEDAIADYEHEKEELIMWLTVVPAEEETVNPKILSAKLVMKRFEDNTPEGYNLLLWGDLKVMFEPNAEDEIWIEKRYPLIKEMLEKMLNWKLEAKAESTMAFELLKFIKSQLED